MTKVQTAEPPKTVAQSVSEGKVSMNVQVNGFAGHPNPTLLALLSNGTIDKSKMSNALSFNGYGGE